MNLRVKFTKKNYLKYISHHDLMRLFERAFRRANIPIKYSEGFNPQPRLSIANPLALGIASGGEYMDIELQEKIPEEMFIESINGELPEDIRVIEVKYIEEIKSLSSLISWSYYEIDFEANNLENNKELEKLISKWLEEEEIFIKKIRHKGRRTIERNRNIKDLIGNVVVKSNAYLSQEPVVINCLLKAGDRGNLNPRDFILAMDKYLYLGIDWDTVNIYRLALFIEKDGKIESPI